jgi:hypothetical protein
LSDSLGEDAIGETPWYLQALGDVFNNRGDLVRAETLYGRAYRGFVRIPDTHQEQMMASESLESVQARQ